MPLLTQESVRRVIENVDIIELISKYVSLKTKGQEASGLCPFHNEKSPSFTVSRKKQFFYCFGCHAKGNVIDYIMLSQKMLFPEAVEHLAQSFSITIDYEDQDKKPRQISSKPLHDLLYQACRLYVQALKTTPDVIAYCKHRGITGATARSFALGYATKQPALNSLTSQEAVVLHGTGLWHDTLQKERFADRLMFPIINPQGKIIGFGGRSMREAVQPKYLNSPETPIFHKSKVLFGMFQALKKPIQQWIIVEGYMDVLLCHQCNITEAVATLGTAFTIDHFKQLNRYCAKIIFCFDGDTAGIRALHRTMQLLLEHVTDQNDIRIILLPDKHDPDSYLQAFGREAFLQQVSQAQSWEQYWEKAWSEDLRLDFLQDKALYLQRAESALKRMPNSYMKQLWLKKIHQYTDVSLAIDEPPAYKTSELPSGIDAIYSDLTYWLIDTPAYAQEFLSLSITFTSIPPTIDTLVKLCQDNIGKNAAQWLESSRGTTLHHLIERTLTSSRAFITPWDDCIAYIKKTVLDYSIQRLLALPSRTSSENNTLKQLLERKHTLHTPHSTQE